MKDITEATTYATVTITDSTYRGSYIFIGKAEAAADTYSAVHKNIYIS